MILKVSSKVSLIINSPGLHRLLLLRIQPYSSKQCKNQVHSHMPNHLENLIFDLVSIQALKKDTPNQVFVLVMLAQKKNLCCHHHEVRLKNNSIRYQKLIFSNYLNMIFYFIKDIIHGLITIHSCINKVTFRRFICIKIYQRFSFLMINIETFLYGLREVIITLN